MLKTIGGQTRKTAASHMTRQFCLVGGRAWVIFCGRLWAFYEGQEKVWLLPIIIDMLVLLEILLCSQGSAVAPFIYTLFLGFVR